VEKGHTRETPRDFISSQDVWSRRSFVKAGVSYGWILLLNSHLTKELVAIQRTSLGQGTVFQPFDRLQTGPRGS
jgi:hypothetical protein